MAAGPNLRRARLLRGMKQGHLAELLGVNQATISRWERGLLLMTEPQLSRALTILRAAPRQASHDAALRQLVEASAERVHMVCDKTHRLLAASGPRWAQWRLDKSDLEGVCMISYASPDILEAEARLADLGWLTDESRN